MNNNNNCVIEIVQYHVVVFIVVVYLQLSHALHHVTIAPIIHLNDNNIKLNNLVI